MDTKPHSAAGLLQLPDACLLAVLSCCADDPCSLFGAARAHSRLHQAAALAASSIKAVLQHQHQQQHQQQWVDSVLLYLTNHGQHVSTLSLASSEEEPTISLQQLPFEKLQGLSNLSFNGLQLQLQPGSRLQGGMQVGAPLKQLHIGACTLLDGAKGLLAALVLLPELQHLSITWNCELVLPSQFLQGLPQLTCLDLAGGELQGADGLPHLQGLTRLQGLQLDCVETAAILTSTLSGMQQLTRFAVRSPFAVQSSSRCVLEAGALAGMTQLQHFEVVSYMIAGGSAGYEELLSHLQRMQQLTRLDLSRCSQAYCWQQIPPAAAFSALTACSKLQRLDVSSNVLPADVWRHMFPTGRQLPLLRHLNVSHTEHLVDTEQVVEAAAAPEGSRLVSCCPGLQVLLISGLRYSTELLAPLTGLSSLQELYLEHAASSSSTGLQLACQLTWLKVLHLYEPIADANQLLQLTQLQQLTDLHFMYNGNSHMLSYREGDSASGGELVWRQVLRFFADGNDLEVAQQAADALSL